MGAAGYVTIRQQDISTACTMVQYLSIWYALMRLAIVRCEMKRLDKDPTWTKHRMMTVTQSITASRPRDIYSRIDFACKYYIVD